EMTGLNPDEDRIIEIATIVTDKELNVLAEGPVLAVHQPPEVLALMDEWNTTTHGNSGLIDRVGESELDERAAEAATLAFLEERVERAVSRMCGNSIYQDRRFFWHAMPQLEAYFQYLTLDVSTIKNQKHSWAPSLH